MTLKSSLTSESEATLVRGERDGEALKTNQMSIRDPLSSRTNNQSVPQLKVASNQHSIGKSSVYDYILKC